MTQPLLIVGSIGLDDVTTPFGSVQGALGGSAVYASAAASYLAPVRFVGVAGGDLPRGAFDFLVRRGVDLEGLQSVPDGRTFRWGGKYSFDLNARDTTFTELNVLADFDPVIPARYVGTPYVLLGNLVPKVQERVLDLVARGKPPAPRPGEGSR
ncbi:MAG TPA: sugar kinase, partial [Candidatus Thermoplasmatota archaeon]|nr:sugar kinase [Candidatus Thermoplasmatota archaeon]